MSLRTMAVIEASCPVGSGAGASALWFFTVLRRSGQRLSFAGR